MCIFIYLSIESPSSSPQGISVTPLSSISFMITWNMSDSNYDYTVIWTNLNTGVIYSCTIQNNGNGCVATDLSVMYSCTVQNNEVSCNVTDLSVDANYNVSVAAMNICGNKTSDPITVYGKYLDVLM